jgi:hypothetical protein
MKNDSSWNSDIRIKQETVEPKKNLRPLIMERWKIKRR